MAKVWHVEHRERPLYDAVINPRVPQGVNLSAGQPPYNSVVAPRPPALRWIPNSASNVVMTSMQMNRVREGNTSQVFEPDRILGWEPSTKEIYFQASYARSIYSV